jgi:hypothetical protein
MSLWLGCQVWSVKHPEGSLPHRFYYWAVITQKGVVNAADAKKLAEALTQKKFPIIEDVDGRVYFHVKGLGARGTAILALWRAYPGRLSKDHLIGVVRRHGYSKANAGMALTRIQSVVDDEGSGNLKLLQPGLIEAEQLLAAAPQTISRS